MKNKSQSPKAKLKRLPSLIKKHIKHTIANVLIIVVIVKVLSSIGSSYNIQYQLRFGWGIEKSMFLIEYKGSIDHPIDSVQSK